LLVVVAIIAILALIAIPAYSAYATTAQVSEGMRMADATETAVAASLQSAGVLPGTNDAAGIGTSAGKYVGAIDIHQGSVTVTYSATAPASIAGKTVTLRPYYTTDGASLGWSCGYASSTVPPGWTIPPLDGLGTAAPADTVPAQFLPKSCRVGG
jgi:type IV pilus assembly protein PilA